MATDWWLFENASAPCFRHYQWAFPETSFGYGQDWEWVVQTTSLSIEKLIRRPTGGGIVKHGSDWTYCLILPQTSFACNVCKKCLCKYCHTHVWGPHLKRGGGVPHGIVYSTEL